MTAEQQLPKGWKIERLGDVIDIQGGSQPPKSEFIYEPMEGYIQLLQIRDFGENGIPTFVPQNRVTKFCDKDDILIARYGASLGRIVTGLAGAYNVALAKTIFDKNLLIKRFVYYLLQTQIFQAPLKMISRSAQNGFAKHEIAHIEIPIPPLETQQAIVNKIESLFDEIDEGIGRLKTAAQQIQQYRQSLLKNAFNGELTKEWRSKHADTLPSEHELLAQIQTTREQHHAQQLAGWQTAVSQWEQNGKEGKKPSKPKAPTQAVEFEENFAGLPSGWGMIKLETLSRKITDGEHFKPPVQEDGIYFLSAKDIRENGISLDEPLFIDQATAEKARRRCDPEKGDLVIVSRGATVGRMCLVNIDEIFCLLGSVILIKPLDFINNVFLNFAMQSPKTNQEMIGLSGSTAQQAIYLRDIKNINIPICSPAEQTQIVAILESKLTACDQLAAELAKQLKQAELLKQAVLKAAFSGNLLDK